MMVMRWLVAVIIQALLCHSAIAELPEIYANQVVDNPDTSRTFFEPWIAAEDGSQLRILQGVPGACRLFGMSDYLAGYVVWSKDLRQAVRVASDGSISDIRNGHYIESMTCISGQPYLPKLLAEEITFRPDGSVTVTMPVVYSGPDRYWIVSGFSVGACRLLGYNATIQFSQEWSLETVSGVSLGFEGKIYGDATGTYLTSLRCKNVDEKSFSSPGRHEFEMRLKESIEQLQ